MDEVCDGGSESLQYEEKQMTISGRASSWSRLLRDTLDQAVAKIFYCEISNLGILFLVFGEQNFEILLKIGG